MPSYTITSITWNNTPAVNQTVSVFHKVQGQPDTSYILDSNNVQIQPNGVLVSPYTITGLSYSTSYTIKISNNCGGSGITLNITTGANPCPDITAIVGSVSNG